MEKLRGTGVAIVTPFSKGRIDFSALKKIIEYVIEGGVDYIVSLGSTGESKTLSFDEKRDILDFTIITVGERKPIVAGNFGASNTEALCRYIDSFNFNGIDAILSSSPSYNKPTQEGIYQHYKQMSEYSPVPIILYNVPGRTASNMSADTTVRLAEDCSNIIGIKEASGDYVQTSLILKNRPDDFLVISGDDPTALSLLQAGGDGVISVAANAFPNRFSSMVRYALTNRHSSAIDFHYSFLDVHPLLYAEGNPAGIKGALKVLGLCEKDVRLPLVPISEETSEKLKDAIYEINNL